MLTGQTILRTSLVSLSFLFYFTYCCEKLYQISKLAGAFVPFTFPTSLTIDPVDGGLYITDFRYGFIAKFYGKDNVTMVFGNFGLLQDGSISDGTARIGYPYGAALDLDGSVLFNQMDIDGSNKTATRSISPDGFVKTIFNNATSLRYLVRNPETGCFFATHPSDGVIRSICTNGTTFIVAGILNVVGFDNNLDPLKATFNLPRSVAFHASGNIYVTDWENHAIRVISKSGSVTTYVGGKGPGLVNGGLATAKLSGPWHLIIEGNIMYFSETYNNVIRRIDMINLTISTVAGNGIRGMRDGIGSSAQFSSPFYLALTSDKKSLYVADNGNSAIRMIEIESRLVSTVDLGYMDFFAKATFSRDGLGSGGFAVFKSTRAMTLNNTFLIVATTNSIKLVSTETGLVKSFVGSDVAGYSNLKPGLFNDLRGMAYNSAASKLYISEGSNNEIREINYISGEILKLAGSFEAGFIDGPLASSKFNQPIALSYSFKRNTIYVGDVGNQAIRAILLNTLQVITVASEIPNPQAIFVNDYRDELIIAWNGSIIYSLNLSTLENVAVCNCSASDPKCCFRNIKSLIVDYRDESIIFTESDAHYIKRLDRNGNVLTIAGTGISGYANGDSTIAAVESPFGIVMDANGNLYFSDANGIIRKIHDNGSSYGCFNGGFCNINGTCTCAEGYFGADCKCNTTGCDFRTTTLMTSNPLVDQGNSVLLYAGIAIGVLIGMGSFSFVCIYYFKRAKQMKRMMKSKRKNTANVTSRANLVNLVNVTDPKQNNVTVENNTSKSLATSSNQTTGNTSTLSKNQSSDVYVPGFMALKENRDFRLESNSEIGQGGFGCIYPGILLSPELVEKIKTHHVVIKVCRKINEDFVEQDFYHEIAIMKTLQGHPNVIEMVGYCQEAKAMILKRYSHDLKNALKLPHSILANRDPNVCYQIALEISKGLGFIHGKDILHLDIKPHNILLEGNPYVGFKCVICDFGCASVIGNGFGRRKFVAGMAKPTIGGMTVRYAAPEGTTMLQLQDHVLRSIKISILLKIKENVMAGNRPNLDLEVLQRYHECPVLIEVIVKCWDQLPDNRPTFNEISDAITKQISQFHG